jgi:endogenous inhibitor of DNA gyrase (YacG/DUF329 family)
MSQNGYALMTEPDDLSAQELGALLAGKARRVDKPCLECRTTMRSVTVRREFCSPKCRQKHWRHRWAMSTIAASRRIPTSQVDQVDRVLRPPRIPADDSG